MKKTILSIIMTALVMFQTVAFAQTTPQIITSNGREICLDAPLGKYVDGVFMVPVRRICDIFDARCTWYGEDRMVVIDSPDNITRLFLYIDKSDFRPADFSAHGVGEALRGEGACLRALPALPSAASGEGAADCQRNNKQRGNEGNKSVFWSFCDHIYTLL